MMEFNVVSGLTDGSKDLLGIVLKKLLLKGQLRSRLVCKRWRDVASPLIHSLCCECTRITTELSRAFPVVKEFYIIGRKKNMCSVFVICF